MVISRHRGFSLIELIAIMVLLGILSAITVPRFFSSSVFELQASRDQVVAAFYSAQQLAMVQRDPIQFSTQSNQLSILQDSNGNGLFESSEAITVDGTRYPLAMPNNVTITPVDLNFDRLGRTSATTLAVALGDASATVTISTMGNAD